MEMTCLALMRRGSWSVEDLMGLRGCSPTLAEALDSSAGALPDLAARDLKAATNIPLSSSGTWWQRELG